MSTGFIYTVNSLTRDYEQEAFCNVPTLHAARLYFGPCKRPMRPKMHRGDYIFGVSPARVGPRRIVFIATIDEVVTFGEAYQRFTALHGPLGPIHVQPLQVPAPGVFPYNTYEHIPGSMHPDSWVADLASPALDKFFVCSPRKGSVGCWLGVHGPEVDQVIVDFFKACTLYGSAGQLSNDATLGNPIAHGGLFTGLHLETDKPESLVALCEARMTHTSADLDRVPVPARKLRAKALTCGARQPTRGCR